MKVKSTLYILYLLFLLSCSGGEKPLDVVNNLDVEKYMGTWYEIARLPNSFEDGLSHITATYTLRKDGKISVQNKGVKTNGKISEVKGVAYIPNKAESAKLEVSFFRPFYGKYWILALDSISYQYALVGHPNRSYLWILSRQPKLPETTLEMLIKTGNKKGFDTQKMVFVNHQ
jgi:apolipoprotein D and lipocalin family protein